MHELTDFERKMLALEVEDQAKNLNKQCKKLSDFTSNLVQKISETDEENRSEIDESLLTFQRDFRIILKKILEESRRICDGFGELSFSEAKENYWRSVVLGVEKIVFHEYEGKLFAKLPLLFPKEIPYYYQASNGRIMLNHVDLYAKDLTSAIEHNDAFKNGHLSSFSKRSVTFLFAYPIGTQAHDCDNHDTKSILDALMRYLPGGDSPDACTVCYISKNTNELEQGTYICINPEEECFIKSDQIISIFRSNRW